MMDCYHSNCTMFEGGVDNMPGNVGFDYVMCNDCEHIIWKKNIETKQEFWLSNAGYHVKGALDNKWNELQQVKNKNKRIKEIEKEIANKTKQMSDIIDSWPKGTMERLGSVLEMMKKEGPTDMALSNAVGMLGGYRKKNFCPNCGEKL